MGNRFFVRTLTLLAGVVFSTTTALAEPIRTPTPGTLRGPLGSSNSGRPLSSPLPSRGLGGSSVQATKATPTPAPTPLTVDETLERLKEKEKFAKDAFDRERKNFEEFKRIVQRTAQDQPEFLPQVQQQLRQMEKEVAEREDTFKRKRSEREAHEEKTRPSSDEKDLNDRVQDALKQQLEALAKAQGSGQGGGRGNNDRNANGDRGEPQQPPQQQPPLQFPILPPEPPDLPPAEPNLRDPLLGERLVPTPRAVANDKSPIDDKDNLLVDVAFGLKSAKPEEVEAALKTRLGAIAFAINSVNTSTKKLLTVSDLMKQLYPGGKFKAGEVPTAKIALDEFLKPSQIATLRKVLSAEPLNCARARQPVVERPGRRDGRRFRPDDRDDKNNDQPQAESLRADVIVKAIMDQKNYYEMLELDNNRRSFEREQGIGADLDVSGNAKDTSEDTLRLILPPGKSGVAHPNAQRLIVLQKGFDGRLVIRTGDVDKNDATKKGRNFIQNPATARPSGSEEIWELPNGMRAYSARNEQGTLLEEVPHGLVVPKISNPRSCFSCHGGTGFVAGSGEFGSQHHSKTSPIKKVNVVDESVGGRTFGGKNLFRANWDDYMGQIAPANKRYEVAVAKTGGDPRDMKKLLDQYAGDVSVGKLAAELDTDAKEVEAALLTKRFRSAWDPSGDFDPKSKDAVKDLSLTRSNLETEVDLGPGTGDERNKRPLYCAVKDLTKEQQARLGNRRPSPDAFVNGPPPKKTHDAL